MLLLVTTTKCCYLWQLQSVVIGDNYKLLLLVKTTKCCYWWQLQSIVISNSYKVLLLVTIPKCCYWWQFQSVVIRDNYKMWLLVTTTKCCYWWQLQSVAIVISHIMIIILIAVPLNIYSQGCIAHWRVEDALPTASILRMLYHDIMWWKHYWWHAIETDISDIIT